MVNRRGYGRALALSGATPIGAAVVVGAVAVPTFYAVAVGALIGVGLRLLARPDDQYGTISAPVPASRPLVLLLVVSVLVTLVAPLVFDGLPVLSPAGPGYRLVAGLVTESNIAQIVYLVLSVGVVAYLARSRWTEPGLVGIPLCLATLLSFWAWAHGASGIPYPEGVFDNSPAFVFQNTLPGGAPRVRGIFSEPAGLATSCLVTIAYCVTRCREVEGLRRLGLLTVAGIALFLGSVSTSTTFLVAGVVLVALAVTVGAVGFVVRGAALGAAGVTLACVAAVAAVLLLPYAANLIGQEIDDKVGTSSYTDRSSADSYSFQLVVDTLGLGTGLGSNRASSFVASLLSTVGIIGTLCFVAVVSTLIRRSWRIRSVRSVVWSLLALLVSKVVSGPDLADSSGVLWLSLGILAHAVSAAPSPQPPPAHGSADGGASLRPGRRGVADHEA